MWISICRDVCVHVRKLHKVLDLLVIEGYLGKISPKVFEGAGVESWIVKVKEGQTEDDMAIKV